MSEITHVSDTALIVAAARAIESASEDAFICDPFAERLAGERGMAYYRALPYPEMMRFGMAMRTRFLDELLKEVLDGGKIDTVLSVGCGLDTRPWRLALPPNLRWVEVDFADMLDYKESMMAGESPQCRRERLVADVNDPAQRQAIYDAAGGAPSVLITEGLLMYLPGSTVDALATETAGQSAITHWIADITTSAFSQALDRAGNSMQSIRRVQAADRYEGEQMLEAIYRQGWSTAAHRSYMRDIGFAQPRIQRMMAGRPQPPSPPPFAAEDPTGVHRFSR